MLGVVVSLTAIGYVALVIGARYYDEHDFKPSKNQP